MLALFGDGWFGSLEFKRASVQDIQTVDKLLSRTFYIIIEPLIKDTPKDDKPLDKDNTFVYTLYIK